ADGVGDVSRQRTHVVAAIGQRVATGAQEQEVLACDVGAAVLGHAATRAQVDRLGRTRGGADANDAVHRADRQAGRVENLEVVAAAGDCRSQLANAVLVAQLYACIRLDRQAAAAAGDGDRAARGALAHLADSAATGRHQRQGADAGRADGSGDVDVPRET